MISRRHLLAALPAAAACGRKPGSGYPGYAFVATGETPSVVAVDLMAFAVRNRIELASPPGALALHPGGKFLYAFTPANSSAEEISITIRARTRSLKLPGVPLASLPHKGTLWCLLRDAPQLAPLGARGITLPAQPVAFDIASEAPLACITLEDGSVVFADLAKRQVSPSVKLGTGLGAVIFRRDAKLVLVAERARRQLTVIETASRQVMTQLPLALSPDHFCMNPDGGQLFITGEGRDAVAIAYPYRTEIAQTSLSGRKPGLMAVSSEPDFLFVANPQAGSVTVFDIQMQKVVAVSGVGVDPGAIAVTPDQQYALVLNQGSGDMAVIRIAAITGGRTRSAPLFTMIPVGARPTALCVT